MCTFFCCRIYDFKKTSHSQVLSPSTCVRHRQNAFLELAHYFGSRVKILIIKLNCDNILEDKLLRFFHYTQYNVQK